MWELLRESVIVQALLALVCMAVVCYLAATSQPIPDVLVNALMLILGFYFGSKTQYLAARR